MHSAAGFQRSFAADAPDGGSMYRAGLVAGGVCRQRAEKPPIFALVAKNDAFSAGFRAAYFQRGRGTGASELGASVAVSPRGSDGFGFRVPLSSGSGLA